MPYYVCHDLLSTTISVSISTQYMYKYNNNSSFKIILTAVLDCTLETLLLVAWDMKVNCTILYGTEDLFTNERPRS